MLCFPAYNTRPAFTLALGAALALGACGSRPGTVVGDAYIVTESGQEVSLGEMPVRLIPESPAIDTLLEKACPRPRYRRAEPETLDSAAYARAWQQRAQILSPQVARTTRADRAAHFAFDTVAPGRYRLWADTSYGGTRWTWLAPVKVESGDSVRIALSNANPDENPFRCRS
ncbi:MAG TPA: hypothetical protein VF092_04140 [Longimicrobium sp.]